MKMQTETNLNVLIIDDETSFTDVLQKRLTKRGLTVRVANDGARGVEEFIRNPPDVVVLDMRMPKMDGVETFRTLNAVDPEAQVIFLTGHVDCNSAITGLDMGAFDYCLKPIDIDVLHDKILDAAERKRLAHQ